MSDDQDTTAPTVNVTIKRVEVTTGDDPDRFIHQLNKAVGRELAAPSSSALGWGTLPEHRWCRWLAGNIREAALEEMRVRAAIMRMQRDPFCFLCGGLLTAKGDCVTHGCASERINTAMGKDGDA